MEGNWGEGLGVQNFLGSIDGADGEAQIQIILPQEIWISPVVYERATL